MTPEERSLLKETLVLAQENNKMLRKLRNSARLGNLMRLFYWLLVIGLSFGSYYLIQPYIDQLGHLYSGLNDGVQTVKNAQSQLGQLGNLPELLKKLGK